MSSEPGGWMRGRPILAGTARGSAVVLEDGISFAMGFDILSGRIIDVHSPSAGETLVGRVLVMPVGRGSSSASGALAEALRLGTGPAAIILREVDEIIAIGGLVARTLYEVTCPIIIADEPGYSAIQPGACIAIRPDGSFRIT